MMTITEKDLKLLWARAAGCCFGFRQRVQAERNALLQSSSRGTRFGDSDFDKGYRQNEMLFYKAVHVGRGLAIRISTKGTGTEYGASPLCRNRT